MKQVGLGAAAMLLALSVASAPVLAQVGAPGEPAPGTPGRTLPRGGMLTFDQVVELQTLLAQLGYDPQGIDGIIGPGTRAAVSAAQQVLGLAVDGEPSLALLQRLHEEPGAASAAPSAPAPLPPAG
jgi:peptidoglycan hydrolase-like protein with peptidoglycan-binding domain